MISAALLLVGLAMLLVAAALMHRQRSDQRQVRRVLTQRLGAIQADAVGVRADEPRWAIWLRARIPAFLERDLARADREIRLRVVIGWSAALLFAVASGAWQAGVFGVAIALATGVAAPLLVIKFLAARRMAAFVELLPHFLDSIRQLLLVGNSLQQALTKATEDAQEPIRRYLNPAIRRIANGASMVDALDSVADRIDLVELHMVVAAIRTNQRSGGSIAPILTALAMLLRDRARVMRELKAASAETRLSAMVLCALPPFAFLLISAINYSYMRYMWETGGGRRLLLIGLGFQLVGVVTMRQLMKLKF
ncbi:type II secretion system F family protein [Sphingomonas sp.]|uniref:type II secretion system F family protein n=1 Tax=Sphingomonas sp. TaxID=28214 RepID=UPI002C0872E1|nr:type II secretion system F family protein [Sphingomonas sp.]HWK36259.1 type II secretion system F family protein [Sphingomonas sp.]